jgi:putative endonuclease
MFTTYILENAQGKLYIGQTSNLEERIAKHNRGGEKYTTRKGPWSIVFQKSFYTRVEALKFERYLKALKNQKYIREKYININ